MGRKTHIATGPAYSAVTYKRVGTCYFYTQEEVDRHVRICVEHGLAPRVRFRRPLPAGIDCRYNVGYRPETSES